MSAAAETAPWPRAIKAIRPYRARSLALALVALIGLPAAATAAAVPGATYSGTASDGAAVALTVSSTGTRVTSYSLTDILGTDENNQTCQATVNELPGGWGGAPISGNAFQDSSISNFTMGGSFGGATTASGTFDLNQPAVGGSPGCSTGTVSWTASVASISNTPLSGPEVFSGQAGTFESPSAISSDGVHVWVANGTANTVTELSASTGAVIQVLSGSNYGFADPDAVSSDGTDVWVANADNTVTELSASTGALIQVLAGSSYGFDRPDSISSDGADVWVANYGGNSVTELSASTGAAVQVLSGSSYEFDEPDSISSDGTHVWVSSWVNSDPRVTELSASTGALAQVIWDTSYGSDYDFSNPTAIYSDGTDVWVANFGDYSVSELSASTGQLVRVIQGPAYQLYGPAAISSDGTHVWVINLENDAVTELSASTGSLIQVLQGTAYGFASPVAISSDGANVWVANAGGNSVTGFPATTGSAGPAVRQTVSTPSTRTTRGDIDARGARLPRGESRREGIVLTSSGSA